jgi:hypothetical protein
MTDRVIVYPGQIPTETHILDTNRSMQDAVHGLLRMTVNGPAAAGFEITASTPAGMSVVLAEGIVSQWASADATAYSSLSADSSNRLKFGSYVGGVVTGFVAPTSTGQSRKYLISASFQETDTGATQLPYYDPQTDQAFMGPTQNTKRIQRAIINLTPGAATNTGFEVAPATPVGALPLYVITVSYGQTTITATHIKKHSDNQFIPYDLRQLRTAVREKLTADLQMYISPSGDDANDGLTALTPKATLQNIHTTVHDRYDLAGRAVYINLAAGIYNQGVQFQGRPVGGTSTINWYIVGNESNPGSVTINAVNGNCFALSFGAAVQIRGVKMTSTGAPTSFSNAGYGVLCFSSAYMELRNVEFGSCGYAHISSNDSSFVTMMGVPYRISGGAQYHILAYTGGTIAGATSSVTIASASAFGTAFVGSTIGGNAAVYSMTFTGAGNVTGRRYVADFGGLIQVGGGGANYLPGSIAGTVATGGNYI